MTLPPCPADVPARLLAFKRIPASRRLQPVVGFQNLSEYKIDPKIIARKPLINMNRDNTWLISPTLLPGLSIMSWTFLEYFVATDKPNTIPMANREYSPNPLRLISEGRNLSTINNKFQTAINSINTLHLTGIPSLTGAAADVASGFNPKRLISFDLPP